MATTGGHRLRASLRKARQSTGIDGVDVGIFADSTYADGTPIAAVQAWNEFGTRTPNGEVLVPERPAVRNAVRASEDGVREIIRENIDSEAGRADLKLAGLVGEHVKGQVQRSIEALKAPPNAPSTIDAKGSSNPLIDVGDMKNSWTWAVIEA